MAIFACLCKLQEQKTITVVANHGIIRITLLEANPGSPPMQDIPTTEPPGFCHILDVNHSCGRAGRHLSCNHARLNVAFDAQDFWILEALASSAASKNHSGFWPSVKWIQGNWHGWPRIARAGSRGMLYCYLVCSL